MLASPHQSHSLCLLSTTTLLFYTTLFFTKHHDLRLSRGPQRNGLIRLRRSLVLPARPGDPLGQCQQRHCRPPL